ncbi:hypothetical protein BDR26DRAFT_869275 [Obelidium mucronatum]|nr:hypothetical protein BDR26DRAFT_869275 [Obelidium mucronatum]
MTIRPNDDNLASLVDQKIARATRDGVFDNLKGVGKPIDFNTEERLNVFVSDTELIMNRMMKAQNALPPWIAKGQLIEQEKRTLDNELQEIYNSCFQSVVVSSSPSFSSSLSSSSSSPLSFNLKSLSSWISSPSNSFPSSSSTVSSPHNDSIPHTNSGTTTPHPFTETKDAEWKRRGSEWAQLKVPQINALIKEYNVESPWSAGKKVPIEIDSLLSKFK